tara:strand:+ start:15735 stop:17657 length:1923 start_codon:yes stop_codon:yes gene_type:complete
MNNYNERKQTYFNLIKQIPSPDINKTISFNNSGKLTVCLIEYRIMEEIKYVLNALLHVYNSNEIGLTIVCGNTNVQYIHTLVQNWENVKIINTKHNNLTRNIYSTMLKMPSFWNYFSDFSHVLIYQTDALILRKIDDIYFDYDYIGAPWSINNQWVKYCAGNGGFSLRRVSAMIKACHRYNNKTITEILNTSSEFSVAEDGYFCSQENLIFPPINSDIHKSFSVEQVFNENPVGCHQVYRYISDEDFSVMINHIQNVFLNINQFNNINIINNNDTVLLFTLFGGVNGVGLCNQIFSLELGIFMSNFFKRKLIILIKHPIAACGLPNWSYGNIFDYVNDITHLLPFGHEIIINKPFETDEVIYTIQLPKHISSCFYVDTQFRNDIYKKDIHEFAHERIDISSHLDVLFDYSKKYIQFNHSNASRIFYNFYTTSINYQLMNSISFHFTQYNPNIMNIYQNIQLPNKYIAIHLRFGDFNKSKHFLERESNIIYNNLTNWLNHNNYHKLPIVIMSDHNEHVVIKQLKQTHNIKFPHEFYNKNELIHYYKNTNVAEFIIDKLICENSSIFLGTRTSTVSVHINYVNYINFKPYIHYVNYNNSNFDSTSLSYNIMDASKKWSWAKYKYDKGNPISWTLFFTDNIYR